MELSLFQRNQGLAVANNELIHSPFERSHGSMKLQEGEKIFAPESIEY